MALELRDFILTDEQLARINDYVAERVRVCKSRRRPCNGWVSFGNNLDAGIGAVHRRVLRWRSGWVHHRRMVIGFNAVSVDPVLRPNSYHPKSA